MHAAPYNSDTQLKARLCARVRHAEPLRLSRRKDDREAANERVKECEREIRGCLWGPLHSVEL